MPLLSATLSWLGMALAAMALTLLKHELVARGNVRRMAAALYAVMTAGAVMAIAWVFVRKAGLIDQARLFHIGLYWLGLALAAETLVFCLGGEKTRKVLLDEYDLFKGGLRVLPLASAFIAPLAMPGALFA